MLKYPKKIYCNFRRIEFVLQDMLHRKLFKAPEEKKSQYLRCDWFCFFFGEE